eukprot:7148130-Prorocentrum_lima.AAC.1
MRNRQEHLYQDQDLAAPRTCASTHQSVGGCLLEQVLLQSGSQHKTEEEETTGRDFLAIEMHQS